MPDENPTRVHDFDRMERDVLYLLTEPSDGEPLWSAEDIGREIESNEPMTPIGGLLRAALPAREGHWSCPFDVKGDDGDTPAAGVGDRSAPLIPHDLSSVSRFSS